ncbi:MAG TPA: aldo/keto reductase [Gammaproteobacteria bacterium]|nr:aldo/keto reductase [Gammaproteobacteria bacterium]
MHYHYLGRTGLKVSTFSLGTWITFNNHLSSEDAERLIDYAFHQGINLFDTAEIYGEGRVETILGRIFHSLKIPRERFLLCTKVFWGGNHPTEIGLNRKHLFEGCHRSLKRLQVDYIDLYLCHRPDPHTSIEETVIGMNLLIQQGKILYWGTSEWPNELIFEAYSIAKQLHLLPPSIEQFEYNMFCRENGEKNYPLIFQKTGIGNLITMPLANGILAGRYNASAPVNSRATLATHPYFNNVINSEGGKNKISIAIQLEPIAQKLGLTLAQLVLCWCLENKYINSIILGVSKISQLQENLQTLSLINDLLKQQTMVDIENILNNKPIKTYEPTYAEVVAES